MCIAHMKHVGSDEDIKFREKTYQIDFASMDRVAMVTMTVYFGYLVVAAVVLDAFAAIVGASYLAVCQPVAHCPSVCTCPCAGQSDVPENLCQSSIRHYASPFGFDEIANVKVSIAIDFHCTYIHLALCVCHVMRYCHL